MDQTDFEWKTTEVYICDWQRSFVLMLHICRNITLLTADLRNENLNIL